MQLLTKANLNVGFPRLVGVCGRLAVLEEEMTPLSSMLDEPFNVRASLAAQILTMIDDFMVVGMSCYICMHKVMYCLIFGVHHVYFIL